jgi:hypothetical protein
MIVTIPATAKQVFNTIIVLSLALHTSAQTRPETYQFAQDIESTIQKDTVPWKYQLGATDYSISAYYQKALETWDKNGSGKPQLSKDDSLYFNTFSKQDAQKYILDRAKNEKIIVINEAHHNSRHRVFTTILLQGLYDQGYRFFGLEALSDNKINQRKFPVLESGFYTKEPQMANLIQTALRIGFTLFEYEASGGKNGKEREIEQAENIAKIMARNPTAKFLIHCGYDHVIEGTLGNKSWEKAMAGWLKEKTKIDPFTIDQVVCTEKSKLEFTNPYILMANSAVPLILVNEAGKTFNGPKANDQTDCRVIHPITQYQNNRPNWLFLNGRRKAYAIPRAKISAYPVLVLAYRKNEFEQDGIPADLVEILDQKSTSPLVLDQGSYQIIIKDRNYKIIEQFEVEVK